VSLKPSNASRSRHGRQTRRYTSADFAPTDQDHRSKTVWDSRRRKARRRGRLGPATRLALLCALYLTFASAIGAGAAKVLHDRSAGAALPPVRLLGLAPVTPKYLVLMVLDGARPDYFNLTALPHVDALRAAGTQYSKAFDGILESETPSGHATIATGSRPDKDGLLGFDWANTTSRYSLFSPDQMGTVEQLMQDSHAPTLASLYKQKFPTARVVALSGHKYYAAAPLGGPSADAIVYYQGDPKGHYVPVAVPGHTPPASVLNDPALTLPTTTLKDGQEDHLATTMALKLVNTMQPRMLLINYPEFDWPLGHVDGGILNPAKVTTDMKVFDSDLGAIEDTYRKAGILDQTLFVITADHGMMPINRFVPATTVSNAVTQAGTTAPDIASSSADYVWLADPNKAQAVAENITGAHDPGIASAYYLVTANGKPSYVAANGSNVAPAMEVANQYLLSALLNGHEPSVVAFGAPGASFSDPTSHWKADHGGNTWQSQSIPLIFSGAGIVPGVVSSNPVQLDDVAPTVLTAMGVAPTGMEGHALTESLVQPTPNAIQQRQTEMQQIGPVVDALMADDQAAQGKS
jgi:predicted AlkP superfamily pyrophosphatase or phosphodiesterase